MVASSITFSLSCLALPLQGGSLQLGEHPMRLDQEVDAQRLQSTCYTSNISGSGWAPANGTFSGERNMCVHGKMLPELYVLGAPKCATTSFAFEMSGAGAECAAGTKEYQFWNPETLQMFDEDPSKTTETWASRLPDCDMRTRRVVADYTPENLALTTRPGTNIHPQRPDAGLPGVLASIYGTSGVHVQFVVMVREPLARMQSWWYYCGKEAGFQDHAGEELEKGMGSAWHSTYGWQLRDWTRVFHMRQFYVIPYKLFNGEASENICYDVSKRLRYKMSCNPAHRGRNRGTHPPLVDDVAPEFRAHFDSSMAGDKAILVDVLTTGSTKNMGLASYDGKPGSAAAVEQWLVSSW